MTMNKDSVVIRTTHGMHVCAERRAEVGVDSMLSVVLVSIRLRFAYPKANQTWKFIRNSNLVKDNFPLFLIQ